MLTTIGRFHAQEGCEEELARVIKEAWAPARSELRCLAIQWYRSIRDPRLFLVHSKWKVEEAFEIHATLPHTVTLLEKAEKLVDRPLEVSRLMPLEE